MKYVSRTRHTFSKVDYVKSVIKIFVQIGSGISSIHYPRPEMLDLSLIGYKICRNERGEIGPDY